MKTFNIFSLITTILTVNVSAQYWGQPKNNAINPWEKQNNNNGWNQWAPKNNKWNPQHQNNNNNGWNQKPQNNNNG